MPGKLNPKYTGRTHAHGDSSIGGQFGKFQAFSEKSVPGNRKVPKFSHPGPGNGSGDVGSGQVMSAKSNRRG